MKMGILRFLSILCCLTVLAGGEDTPDIQLAGFDDLFKLATAGWSGQDSMQDRDDRSLAHTFPFNHVEKEDSVGHSATRRFSVPRGSPSDTSYTHSRLEDGLKPSEALVNAESPANQDYSLGSGLFQNSGSDIKSQAYSTFSNIKAQAGGPASSFHPEAGFTLPAGYGSQSKPTAQEEQLSIALAQASAAATSYSAATPPLHSAQQFANFPSAASVPKFARQHYQQENEVPAITVTKDAVIVVDTSIARAANQCPAASSLSPQQCQGAVHACWSVGISDVDCPGNSLCCFDGCANVCYGQARAVVRPGLKQAPSFINPNRRRNPAQRRRKPAGQTFEEVAAAGQRCIDKIEQVEEIEYDQLEECHHSYDKKCHTSYSTEYESQQEEECNDNYKKACDITYSPKAQNVTVRVCMTPLVKDCNLPGPELCRTEYICECWTKNVPHIVEDDVPKCRTEYEEKCVEKQSGYVTQEECSKWPREVCTVRKELMSKFNPVTKCEKVPQELCGPSGCGFVPGPEECHHQVKTVVTDIPNEICDLQPLRKCAHVTKLVPKLTPVEECVDVPKEICQTVQGNPRTVLKPVTKKWCYTPSQESGLV